MNVGLHRRPFLKMHLVLFKLAVCFSRKWLCLTDIRVAHIFVGFLMRAKHENIIHSPGWRHETFHPCNDVFAPGFIVIGGFGYNCCAALARRA